MFICMNHLFINVQCRETWIYVFHTPDTYFEAGELTRFLARIVRSWYDARPWVALGPDLVLGRHPDDMDGGSELGTAGSRTPLLLPCFVRSPVRWMLEALLSAGQVLYELNTGLVFYLCNSKLYPRSIKLETSKRSRAKLFTRESKHQLLISQICLILMASLPVNLNGQWYRFVWN